MDDVGYLTALVDEIKNRYSVDDYRVYFFGHSNGGFMSCRMACEHPGMVAAVASLAGAMYFNAVDCVPPQRVYTLQIHGTADARIGFSGGTINQETVVNVPYPGAVQTVETWAAYDRCSLTPDTSQPPLDLDSEIEGAESTVTRYAFGCGPGGSTELWTIQGGGHSPTLSSDFSRNVVLYLLAHPKRPGVPAFNLQGLFALVALVGAAGIAVPLRRKA